ncbi:MULTISPECIES: DUF2512 family protein [Solibacillus]|uniref:DUF2512 family protein n=1 Tax=Solibacillus TaxID=648800 RepID=UPI00203EC5A4|nr:DUF2512 family protein [Solibacillus isronensis]MCM3722864.1 YndM family protein [Solibacillus isronensis]
MNHLKALVIKFVMIAAVLGIILAGFFDFAFSDTLVISLVLTLLAYVVGDLGIFQNAGTHAEQDKRNIIATLSDVLLAAIVIYFMAQSYSENNDNIVAAAIVSAVVIGLGEWFFHKYIDRQVFDSAEATDAQRDY